MKEYPPDWPEIAERIKKKNGYRCEKCKHKHDPNNGYCLTVHHLDRDPQNNEEYNLVSACQRCHLRLEGQARWLEKWGLTVFDDSLFIFQPRKKKVGSVEQSFPEWFKPHWEGYLRSREGNGGKSGKG